MTEEKIFSEWDVDLAKPTIKQYEGLRLTAYRCSAGVWTNGWGHTQGVTEGQEIDLLTAELWLDADLKYFQKQIALLMPNIKVCKGAFIAILSFVFNVGIGAFRGSTMLRLLKKGWTVDAKYELRKWVYVNGKRNDGLVRRRESEFRIWSEYC